MSKELIDRLRKFLGGELGNDAANAIDLLSNERDALAAELKSLREQEPVGIVDEDDDGVFADLETANGVLVKLGDKLYALPVPAESAIESSPKPVSPDLLESARAVVARWDAPTWKDLPATAEYIGRLRVAIAQADLDGALTAEEWVVKNVSGSAGLVRAMVIRAEAEESAIETPAKVSPCAGHAVQQESDDLVGLRGCNSRHGVQRAEEPCGYRMRATDPGCTGCAERDEDQPTKAGDSILGEQK